MPDVRDLELLVQSQVPIIVIESSEEERVVETLRRLAAGRGRTAYRWTVTDGLRRLAPDFALQEEETFSDPERLLQYIRKNSQPTLYALCDFHPYLQEAPRIIRLVKDIALRHAQSEQTLVLVSHAVRIPPELRGLTARFSLTLPSSEQILALVREEAAAWSRQHGGSRVRTEQRTLRHLVRNLAGLTMEEVRRLARVAIVDDGAIDAADLPEVNRAKFELMNLDGLLGFEYATLGIDEIAGLERLKRWLDVRRRVFAEGSVAGLEAPRGLLLLGVQGCGKSMAARAVAGLWQLPCLRLDMGVLYNKFFGETERNLREALRMAEAMAPCVLWIDEIEKGLSQAVHDEGVSRRVLGTLLTWMAERKAAVFLVATANDIHGLPPELIRKGRFDEIFFLDLPNATVRASILALHLKKRQQDPGGFDLDSLAALSEGFSGAELEQVVVAALYRVSADQAGLDTAALAAEITTTRPLSVIREEEVEALRAWASERCVPAE